MAPDYENLTLIQKMEVFQCALDNTNGNDLYKVLWLKSKNSEVHPALSIRGRERDRQTDRQTDRDGEKLERRRPPWRTLDKCV
jgi:hypothetical protein